MAEPGINLGFPDIQIEVAHFLGFSSDSTKWNAEETDLIDRMIQSGYRQFLYPNAFVDQVTGQRYSHIWDFLAPTTTLAILSATSPQNFTLPDNFGGIVGGFTFDDSSLYNFPIEVVDETKIMSNRSSNLYGNYTGMPSLVAIRPKSHTGTTSTRFEAIFWPDADSNYTLNYRYNVIPGKLSASIPYAPGLAIHAETLKLSCLSRAELYMDRHRGEMHMAFLDALASSVSQETQLMAPDKLGYNSDSSDARGNDTRRTNKVTLEGVLYT